MKAKEIRKLLEKADRGDTDARRELALQVGSAKVFVLDGGKLDVTATAGAIQYLNKTMVSPDEWDDTPTVSFDQAFAESQQLNPLTFKPVTPGTWTKLWELPNGHRLVAIIYYGKQRRHIVMSDLEVRDKVKALVSGTPWELIESVAAHFDADEAGKAQALAAVVGKRWREKRVPKPIEQFEPSSGSARDPYNVTDLHGMLVAGFSAGEINTLCFDVGVDHENLRGSDKSSKARELVMWAQRYSKMRQLVDATRRGNPSMFRRHFG